jgi:ABC-type polysaccharide/polyol phosphate transport system ATPase subunit
MVARLGFAIATDVEPDILLVDEVLAVGDLEFQRKCLDRMHRFRARGATLIVVSHSTETVLGLCERALWFDGGRLLADGTAREVVEMYVSPRSPQVAHAIS